MTSDSDTLKNSSRLRHCCGTINNPDGSELAAIASWGQLSYSVVGSEVGESGTPHLQFYFEFKQQVLLSTLKKKISKKAHVEVRRGTQLQASDYCKKDGIYVEKGEMAVLNPGRRSDIELCREMVLQGHSLKEIALVASNYQALRCAEKLISILEKNRDVSPVRVIWASGEGAKEKIFDHMDDVSSVYVPLSLHNWDGYDSEDVVYLELPEKSTIRATREIERYLDRYPFRVKTGFGSRQARYHTIYISTPCPNDLVNCSYILGIEDWCLDLSKYVTLIL